MMSSPIRSQTTLAGAALAMLLLSGCTVVGPDYAAPSISLPAQWASDKTAPKMEPAANRPATPPLSHWWEEFGDPTLNRLIDLAMAQNLDVAAARATIRQARANYRQVGGSLSPSLDGSTSFTEARSNNTTSSTFQGGFDASWELDLFGGKRRQLEAAAYVVDASEADLRDTMLTLIGDIASNYISASGFRARIELARRTAVSQRETEALTRTQFEAGAAAATDMANAAGQAASTEANIPTLEVSYAAAVHRLSVLTGQPPAALVRLLDTQTPIPAPQRPIPTGVPADILLTRPDVRSAERQLAQYTALIGEAEAARYPSVSLSGAISISGSSLGDLAKGSSIGWSFGPSMTVPIFNDGQLEAAVEAAVAQRDQYEATFRSTVLTALEDVENAIVALAQEKIRYGKLAESTEAFRQATDLARSLYQAGSSSFLDVLDAERSLYSAEDSLLQSQVTIATAYVTLNKALGGGWDGIVEASATDSAN